MNKGGQGLPLNFIVIAAIAVVVLILVIAFATGTLSRLFKSAETLSETATPEEISTFRIGCKQACFQAKQLASTELEWSNSEYCNRTINISETEEVHCWQDPVFVECNKTETIQGTVKEFCAEGCDIPC